MQRRNVTILVITLIAIAAGFFGYLYFSNPTQSTNPNSPTNTAQKFFPFTSTPATPVTPAPTPANVSGLGTPTPTPVTTPVDTSKIKKISSFPIAGYGIFSKEVFTDVPVLVLPPVIDTTATGTTDKKTVAKPTPPATEFVTTVRYTKKETGNIYQTLAKNVDERLFTTTVIPKLYEAFFGNKAGSVAMRYLKEDGTTIETYLGTLPTDTLGADSTANTQLKGTFLPENITDMSVSPDSSQLFYLFTTNNTVVGIVAGALGDKKTQVFSSPFTEWILQWPNAKMITLTTKAAATLPGYMYAINPDRKDFSKVFGGINGLTTLTSPNGSLVLYNSSSNGGVNLYLYHKDTGASDLLGVKTLPEKCVWATASDALYCAVPKYMQSAAYPDAWYQGLISFSDEIWKIDAVTGSASKISDPVNVTGETVDGVKLALDDSQNFLFFINKKDNYLWELGLK